MFRAKQMRNWIYLLSSCHSIIVTFLMAFSLTRKAPCQSTAFQKGFRGEHLSLSSHWDPRPCALWRPSSFLGGAWRFCWGAGKGAQTDGEGFCSPTASPSWFACHRVSLWLFLTICYESAKPRRPRSSWLRWRGTRGPRVVAAGEEKEGAWGVTEPQKLQHNNYTVNFWSEKIECDYYAAATIKLWNMTLLKH